jgi:peptidoglycan/LPS O-acetylase OafA/YrhL
LKKEAKTFAQAAAAYDLVSGQKTESHKNHALESLRGIASLGVLVWHSLLAFFPGRTGIYVASDHAFNTAAWFGLIYGTGWVTFFFALSGYVLTRGCFLAGSQTPILRNALKRWPRLALPVLLTVMASWALYAADAYSFPAAGKLDGSPWFGAGGGMRAPGPADFWEAATQGAFTTFLRGDMSYDNPLWTMHIEFVGSYIAFGLALLLLCTRHAGARWYMIATAIITCCFAGPFYAAFPAGVALAACLPRRRWTGLPGLMTASIGVAGIFLMGYSGVHQGAYRVMVAFWPAHLNSIAANVLGAILLIVATEQSAGLHALLSQRWGIFLGRLSFPLYLVHVPVICSLGAAAYLHMHPDPAAWAPRLAALALSAAAAIAAAYPLMWVNESWVKRLNRWMTFGTQPVGAA